jgi:hypothetical protein
MLSPSIRDIQYLRFCFADEIVDSFHGFNKEELINDFEKEYYKSFEAGISLNSDIEFISVYSERI